MTALARLRSPRARLRLVALVVLALVAAALWQVRSDRGTELTAYFESAPGLYQGDEVRVLGVKVGTVTAVEPEDGRVAVHLEVQPDQKVPADVRAAIVAPSLVSGRFVQLAPAWTEGPTLSDGGEIPKARTAIPVSFDEVKRELTDLATALGPRTKADRGSLAEVLETLDANLSDGNSRELRRALTELHGAASALSSGRSDLFATVRNLNSFTRNLAVHDAAVGGFTSELDNVSTVLSDNRKELGAAVKELQVALGAVGSVSRENRTRLRQALRRANTLAATTAGKADELAGVLHVAPHSLMGLHNIVDRQAITGRAVLANADSLAALLCGALLGAGGTQQQCQTVLGPLVDVLGLSEVLSTQPTAPSGGPSGGPAPSPTAPDQLLPGTEGLSNDLTNLLGLGGLL